MRDRIPSQPFREAIGEALRVTARFAHFLDMAWICGVDPVFAGVHRWTERRTVPHCCYSEHLDGPATRRLTTIMLPVPVHPYVIVHELGHVLDQRLGFDHLAEPITDYAQTNRYEAFAEAFCGFHYRYGDQEIARGDRATIDLFRSLAL